MESGDLCVTLGLSSYESDLWKNWIGDLESMQGKELFESYKNGRFKHI